MFRLNSLKYKNGPNAIIKNLFVAQSTVAARKTTPTTSTSSADKSEQIVIPKKINRGPTDLLYTLSKTVGRDPTAAHYKFHDDPYLMPTSVLNKQHYALSYESGKETAQWIKREHAVLFNVSKNKPFHTCHMSCNEQKNHKLLTLPGKRCTTKNRGIHPKNRLYG